MKDLTKLQKIEDMINECVGRIWQAKEYLSKKEALMYHYFEGNVTRHLEDCERALPRLKTYFNNELEKLRYNPRIIFAEVEEKQKIEELKSKVEEE